MLIAKIIVPIKQVPESSQVKINEETGTIIREGVENIINPLDLYAIESAIQLREAHGGSITVISMGPPKAEIALREAIAMGADKAILLSGREFAGSDTWVTAYSLAALIEKIKPYDLIITGERATEEWSKKKRLSENVLQRDRNTVDEKNKGSH